MTATSLEVRIMLVSLWIATIKTKQKIEVQMLKIPEFLQLLITLQRYEDSKMQIELFLLVPFFFFFFLAYCVLFLDCCTEEAECNVPKGFQQKAKVGQGFQWLAYKGLVFCLVLELFVKQVLRLLFHQHSETSAKYNIDQT